MRLYRKGPADLGITLNRIRQITMEIGKTELADESTAGPALDRPVPESQQSPMTTVRQQPLPRALRW